MRVAVVTESFLPQVGFTWALSDDSELFASYSKNMRAFAAARTGLSMRVRRG